MKHEFLERSHLFQVTPNRSPEDPPSQVADNPIGFAPLDNIPVGSSLGYVCRTEAFAFAFALHLTFPFD